MSKYSKPPRSPDSFSSDEMKPGTVTIQIEVPGHKRVISLPRTNATVIFARHIVNHAHATEYPIGSETAPTVLAFESIPIT